MTLTYNRQNYLISLEISGNQKPQELPYFPKNFRKLLPGPSLDTSLAHPHPPVSPNRFLPPFIPFLFRIQLFSSTMAGLTGAPARKHCAHRSAHLATLQTTVRDNKVDMGMATWTITIPTHPASMPSGAGLTHTHPPFSTVTYHTLPRKKTEAQPQPL